ncbi:unnamed protein product [Alopecurus aequalis]
MAPAPGPCTSPDWSDLPTDLLTSIVQLLDLPGALAFASVCASWCSVAVAAGTPPLHTPWLMSWEPAVKHCGEAVTCEFRRPLVDVDRVHKLTFPEGAFVTCCGASGGWLVVVDELCNLSLHNAFTSRTIPLPPVTDFPCVEALRDGQGNITRYLIRSSEFDDDDAELHDTYHLATFFYRKAVLSGDPSGGGDYAVTVIHHGGEWVSHVRAGDARWQVLVPNMNKRWRNNRYPDTYADCASHDGWIYAVSYWGYVDRWLLDAGGTPSKEAVHYHHWPWRLYDAVLTRHLVVPPGGGVWLVSAVWEPGRPAYPDAVKFTFHEVNRRRARGQDEEASRRESVQEHALFLGMNRSAYLPAKSFPGVRPGVLYFTAPWMRQYAPDQLERVGDWGGARAYDLPGRSIAWFPACCLRLHV